MKKFLALLLSVMMVMTFIPAVAWAESGFTFTIGEGGILAWDGADMNGKIDLYIDDVLISEIDPSADNININSIIDDRIEMNVIEKKEQYQITLKANDKDSNLVGQQTRVYKYQSDAEPMITAVYERTTPFEVIIERDFKDYGTGLYYYGETFDYPDAGDKVTFTFPDGTVKKYEYQRSGSSYGKFVNVADSTDVINYNQIYINLNNQAGDWAEGGDKNYYEVTFINYPADGDDWITCRVPVSVSSTPVASVEFEPVPVLRWTADAARSGMPYGNKVTVTYKDGTTEVFIDNDMGDWVSQTTGEAQPWNDDDIYYNITDIYDPEDLSMQATYMGVKSAKNYSASYVAQSISLYQAEPMVLRKGINSVTATDVAGSEYENYSLYRYNWFGEDDVLTVKYKNALDEYIYVDYARYDETSFQLAEDSPYRTGYADDHLSSNYITIHMPDQSENHFEIGKTYSMDMTFHMYGSNFDLPEFTTTGEPYKVKIADQAASLTFEDGTGQVRIEKGSTYQLKAVYEPDTAEPEITWESSRPAIATVDENGLVTALAAGNTTITVTADNQTASRTVYVYEVKTLTEDTVTVEDAVYTGEPIESVNVRYNSSLLTKDTNYTVTFENNTNIGDATVVITGVAPYYTGQITKTFKIKGDLSKAVTGIVYEPDPIPDQTYTGSPIEPKLSSVKAMRSDGQVGELTEGVDYHLEYMSNTNESDSAILIIKGDGYYTGTKYLRFRIVAAKPDQMISAKISASKVSVGKTAAITVTGAEGELSYASSDTSVATVSASGKVTAKKVGTAKITVTAAETDDFNSAKATVTVKVVPGATSSVNAENLATGIKVTWKKVTGANGYKVYRGTTLVKTITSGSTVTYTDTKANTNGTKYTFKVVATASTGDSTLSKSKTFYRVSRPTISSLTNSAANKMTVKWAKNSKATGYEVQYSTSKTFASGNKTVKINSASTVTKVIGSLTKGKTYYVRIRTYKTVSGSKYYSAYSTKKYVKISK
ncbi:MAG: Ig-like domain-containing protein [Firmicutes bacterium]|nr:Ig-like domain-containing protein [Bacillota bacterium]